MSNSAAFAFQQRAQLTRSELGVDASALRPTSAPEHVDIAVPGFVGPGFSASGVCLVSVNPAGGKNAYRPSTGDRLIYEAAASLAKASSEHATLRMADLGRAFIASMPAWGSQWQHVKVILGAMQLRLDSIAYVYLVPFRTKDDAGSRLPTSVLQLAAQAGFRPVLDALSPQQIITMDRPSYNAALSWNEDRNGKSEVIYYTRKRDDHAGRAKLLNQLRAINRDKGT